MSKTNSEVKFIVFKVNNVSFAINLDDTESIVASSKCVSIESSADSYIDGLVQHRGHVISQVDLSCLLFNIRKDITETDKLIVYILNNKMIALRVESVESIVTVNKNDIIETDSILSDEKRRVLKIDDNIIQILDMKVLCDIN